MDRMLKFGQEISLRNTDIAIFDRREESWLSPVSEHPIKRVLGSEWKKWLSNRDTSLLGNETTDTITIRIPETLEKWSEAMRAMYTRINGAFERVCEFSIETVRSAADSDLCTDPKI